MGEEVQRQLAILKLPNHELHELFQKEFRNMGVNLRDLPPYNKISLTVWFDRVSRRLGVDKLMQATNSIVARRLPRTQMDWPLKRDA